MPDQNKQASWLAVIVPMGLVLHVFKHMTKQYHQGGAGQNLRWRPAPCQQRCSSALHSSPPAQLPEGMQLIIQLVMHDESWTPHDTCSTWR